VRLEAKIQTMQTKLDGVKDKHDRLAVRVQHMRPSNLDTDLVDEQARRTLNYTAPDEIVIYDSPHNQESH